MTLKPGWYLVGRRDGKIDPFFVEIGIGGRIKTAGSGIACHTERGKIWKRAYWWERQEIPSTIHEALGITEGKG